MCALGEEPGVVIAKKLSGDFFDITAKANRNLGLLAAKDRSCRMLTQVAPMRSLYLAIVKLHYLGKLGTLIYI